MKSLTDLEWAIANIAIFVIIYVAFIFYFRYKLKWKARTIELKKNKDHEACYQVAQEMLLIPLAFTVIIMFILSGIGLLG